MKLPCLAILAALVCTTLCRAQGVAVFSDDFSTAALLIEKWKLSSAKAWKVEGGQLLAPDRGGTRVATANVTHDGPIEVQLRLKAVAFDGARWCGVRVRGVHFTLRRDCFWYVYNIHGKKRALGNSFTAGKPASNQWHDFRIVNQGTHFQWFVDGRLLFEFNEPSSIQGGDTLLAVATAGPAVAFDDVQVRVLPTGGDASPNLLRNSSFEVVPDHVPTAWTPRFISHVPPEIVWRDWRVDEGEAHHGERSLRIVGNRRTGNGFFPAQTGIAVGKPCTFSVYLKADQPGRKARLVFWEWLGRWRHKPIVLTAEWQRYSFTLEAPEKNRVRGGLEFREDGVIWADAAQLELGSEATEYAPCALDAAKPGAELDSLPTAPPRALRVVDAPPVLDGRLDDAVWSDPARVWPLLRARGKAPTEKTDAYVLFSQGVLYVGMRCHDSQMEKLTAKVEDHDGNVFLDDSIEIFLDTNLDRLSYYQLTVNSKGVRFDAAPGRNRSWNGDWQARTFVGEGFWSVEAALPLATLDVTPATSPDWGMNLCRHCARLGEYSATAVTLTPNFHKADRYPVLKWPGADVFRPFLIVPVDLELVEVQPGRRRLAGRLTNRTGQARTVRVRGDAPGGKWESPPVTVAPGKTVEFSVDAVAVGEGGASEATLAGAIVTDEQKPRVLRRFQLAVPVRPLFGGLLERSVYSVEDKALFLAEIRLSPEQLQKGKVRLTLGKDGKRSVEFAPLAERMDLALPIADLPPGSHPLVASLLDAGGAELAVVKTTVKKLPPSRTAVAIDRARQCLLVRGKPILPIMPLYSLHWVSPLEEVDARLNHWADSGFTAVAVVCHINRKETEAIWECVFARAAERDLKIVAWPAGFNKLPLEEFGKFIERWKDHPALLVWHPVDEPELYAKAEEVVEIMDYFAERDPYHPVYMNNTVMGIPSRFAGLAGDIVSLDDYLTNRPGRKVIEMVRDVEMMREAAAPTRRPVWLYLTGNNLQNHTKEPSAAQQVAQTYGCVIAGASGIKYFLGDPVCKAHWTAMKRTNREITSLAPVIFSRQPAPAVECSSAAIVFMTRRVGSNVYLISVNLEDRAVDATFALSDMDRADAVVLFEDRVVRLESGSLKDAFAPHQRHVYRLHAR